MGNELNHGFAEFYEDSYVVEEIGDGTAWVWRHSGVPACVFILEPLQS